MSSALLLLLSACGGDGVVDSAPSFVGPALTHNVPAPVVDGVPVELSVTAVDEDGVAGVDLVHRLHGASQWATLPMVANGDDSFTVTLEADSVHAPSVDYFFKATDAAETAATSYLPVESTTAPFELPVSVKGASLPFVADFEKSDGVVDLSGLGWGSASTNFRGYPWQLSDAEPHGGASSAYHPRGYAGTEPLQDFLVSPAIDLSTASDAQVTWWEYGASVADANHALFASTGSRDPADGDYVWVTQLAAPLDGEWQRSAPMDLSSFVGNPAVYLAWYFEGVDADDWWLDDVRVEARQADLSYGWEVAPSPIAPGESGTLTVTVTNPSDLDASGAVVTLGFPEGGASAVTTSMVVDTVPALSTVDAVFPVVVDGSTPINSYVPMDLGLTWGSSERSSSERFLVGTASVAHIEVSPSSTGLVELVLGVGSPDAPRWELPVFAEVVGTGVLSFDLDVTEQGDLLPPAPGQDRWYLRGRTAVASTVGAFEVSTAGMTYAATEFPVVLADTDFVVWVPEPPSFTVSATTSPAELDPGVVGASTAMSISNSGATTTGALLATLSSDDPDVVVTDAGPIDLGRVDAGRRVSLIGFAFDVDSAHVNSRPVKLRLELQDDAESWSIPVSFEVPYPVLRITSIEVDDDGSDGILDPGESADLTFHVTNVGDEGTSGAVEGSLSVESSSTASGTASLNTESFSTISPGVTRDSRDFTVTVDGGSAGDWLDLLLTLTDSVRTYEARTTLTLSEPPWQSLDTLDDDAGDVLDGWDFDLLNGEYRVYGGLLQIRMVSATAFDPTSLFIEAWGLSAGADWIYYRLVLQSGVVDLQGYDHTSGFVPINEPMVSYPDSTTVQFDIVLDDMGLFLDEFSIGIGSGWCGPPEYYCDQYPNGWGYPYDSFSTASWFQLSW